MEAIILAGGLGTRLSHIVQDVPKPMALINGKPFLEYLFFYLKENKIKDVVLAVGYMGDSIINHFGNKFNDINIKYSVEESRLGTGGAIKQAVSLCQEDNVFVLNGDTFFDLNLEDMMSFHQLNNSDITIATKRMKKFDRYGTLNIEKDRIISFNEKKYTESGIINAGIYIFNKKIFSKLQKKVFSIEKDVFENDNLNLNKYAFQGKGYFIDIGIPEDYYKAQEDFSKLKFLDAE